MPVELAQGEPQAEGLRPLEGGGLQVNPVQLKELSSGQEVAFGTQKVRLQEPKLHVPPYQIAVYDEVLNRDLTTVHIFRSGLYPAPPVLEWRDGRRFFFSAPAVIGSYSSSGFQYGILLQDASGRMIARTN